VVISTGTKNLQEQLFFKDIPFLEQFFPGGIRACLMKGRANYLCRQKLYDAEKEPILEGLEEVSDFAIIREWEKSHRQRRPGHHQRPDRGLHRLGQARCAARDVHRLEVPSIRALLHHADARARRWRAT
jgi:Rad3-related DNA helicase